MVAVIDIFFHPPRYTAHSAGKQPIKYKYRVPRQRTYYYIINLEAITIFRRWCYNARQAPRRRRSFFLIAFLHVIRVHGDSSFPRQPASQPVRRIVRGDNWPLIKKNEQRRNARRIEKTERRRTYRGTPKRDKRRRRRRRETRGRDAVVDGRDRVTVIVVSASRPAERLPSERVNDATIA